MKIRKATKKDATAIAEIHRTGEIYMNSQFQDDHIDNYPAEEYLEYWNDMLEPYSEGETLVYEDKNGVEGIACYANDGEYSCELFALYVTVSKIGYGVGSQLLSAVEENIVDMGFDSVTLTTPKGNEIGIAFYENKGYVSHDDGYGVGGVQFVAYQKKL